jgi:small subunit ribosomal protein S20
MPNTASAKKTLRKDKVRRLRNRSQRSSLRTVIKKVLAAVVAGDRTAADAALKVVVKRLDQAAAKRLIHPNKAARTKSRLAKRVATVGAKG